MEVERKSADDFLGETSKDLNRTEVYFATFSQNPSNPLRIPASERRYGTESNATKKHLTLTDTFSRLFELNNQIIGWYDFSPLPQFKAMLN